MSLAKESAAPTIEPVSKAAESNQRGELRLLWRRYRWRILLTYALFNVENVLRLAQPLLLGWAINDLLKSSYQGLAMFAGGHLAHLFTRTARQMYDTRTFTRIYAERVSELVVEQRTRGVGVSQVAARSTLSREFVDFLEQHVPIVIRSLYSVIGALVMLALFDGVLVLYCAAVVLPACVVNFVYGRQSMRISRLLHDDLEREVQVVDRADRAEVRDHYGRVSRRRVHLSDWEAATTGLMELFILALMTGALVHYCAMPRVGAGDIFAVFRYVLLFIMALDSLPMLVGQVGRLKDIGRRIHTRI